MHPPIKAVPPYEALEVRIAELGLQAFAKAVAQASDQKLTYQAVQKWLAKRRVPADRCLAVEEVTDGQVTRYQLRPDVFGEAPTDAMREAG